MCGVSATRLGSSGRGGITGGEVCGVSATRLGSSGRGGITAAEVGLVEVCGISGLEPIAGKAMLAMGTVGTASSLGSMFSSSDTSWSF